MSDPLIVGAGIGGLTAAVALAAYGRSCTVVERLPALSASGYGIQLPPNATRVLSGLGLGPALDAVSLRLERREIRRWSDGSLLGSAALDRWDAPYLVLRRAALLRVLHSRVPDVQFGCSFPSAGGRSVIGADGLHSAVRGRLASDGSGCSFPSADGRLVIGADGLHSAVRGRLASDELIDVGYTAYRAVLPVRDARPVVTVWLGPGAHVVAYPVPDGLNVVAITDGLHSFDGWHEPVRALAHACMRGCAPGVASVCALGVASVCALSVASVCADAHVCGGARVGVDGDARPRAGAHVHGVASVHADAHVHDGAGVCAEGGADLCVAAHVHDGAPACADGCAHVCVDARARGGVCVCADGHALGCARACADGHVLGCARACADGCVHGSARGFVLRTRPPLATWHRDGVVVLGDAAHPMPPFLAQGAAQAVEDAAALPAYLDDLAGFEAARRPRVERVVAASMAGGHEYHLPDGAEQRRRDKRIAAAEPPGQDWLYT